MGYNGSFSKPDKSIAYVLLIVLGMILLGLGIFCCCRPSNPRDRMEGKIIEYRERILSRNGDLDVTEGVPLTSQSIRPPLPDLVLHGNPIDKQSEVRQPIL